MEGLFALIAIFIIFNVLGSVLGFGARAVGAGAKTLWKVALSLITFQTNYNSS